MIAGITGSIGSGKTTAAKLFGRHNYSRIDADEISHDLMKNNPEIRKEIIKNFGNKILGRDKNIDREKLREIVFSDAKKLKKLNSIMHPAIISSIKKQIKKIQNKRKGRTKILIDSPLLIETNAKKLADRIIVVRANAERIIKRSKRFSGEEIETILKRQMPPEEKLKYADFVIDNNKSLKHLEKQVIKVIGALED